MIITLAGLMVAIAALVIGGWLWFGIEVYHMFWYAGPLAAAGYIGWLDNLFKCSILLVWSICWMAPGVPYEWFSPMIVAVALIGVFRTCFVWRS